MSHPSTTSFRLDHLLEHGPWVRTLARSLLHDGNTGDDLWQEFLERAAARPETVPTAGDLATGAATRRMLIQTVLALDPPHRDVILLRYFEGLEPLDVAMRTGVRTSTVRTRIAPGLNRLRDYLDRQHGGDDRNWRVALAPLFVSPGAVPDPRATDTRPAWAILALLVLSVLAGAAAVVWSWAMESYTP